MLISSNALAFPHSEDGAVGDPWRPFTSNDHVMHELAAYGLTFTAAEAMRAAGASEFNQIVIPVFGVFFLGVLKETVFDTYTSGGDIAASTAGAALGAITHIVIHF